MTSFNEHDACVMQLTTEETQMLQGCHFWPTL